MLARLHATSGARYGWPTDYAFGPVAIANGWTEDWPCFWAERRLLVHLTHLPSALARRVERLPRTFRTVCRRDRHLRFSTAIYGAATY